MSSASVVFPTPSGPASRIACGGAPATIAPTASRAVGWPRVYARFTPRSTAGPWSGRFAGRRRAGSSWSSAGGWWWPAAASSPSPPPRPWLSAAPRLRGLIRAGRCRGGGLRPAWLLGRHGSLGLGDTLDLPRPRGCRRLAGAPLARRRGVGRCLLRRRGRGGLARRAPAGGGGRLGRHRASASATPRPSGRLSLPAARRFWPSCARNISSSSGGTSLHSEPDRGAGAPAAARSSRPPRFSRRGAAPGSRDRSSRVRALTSG